ncbi:MAG: hypothetical protein GY679_01175 [Mycoplasma sp.]|nr:hypothetical protein [Mycoplasma sp.]
MKEINSFERKGNLEFNTEYLRVREWEENIFTISDILCELPCLGGDKYIECHYSKENSKYFLCSYDHIAYEHCYEEKMLIVGKMRSELEKYIKKILELKQRLSRLDTKELQEEWEQTERILERARTDFFELEPTRALRGFILGELKKRDKSEYEKWLELD